MTTSTANQTPDGEGLCSASSPSAMTATPVDMPALMKMVGGDTELLAELMRLFAGEAPPQLSRMQDAVANSDASELRAAAHHLKGSAGTLCLSRLSGLAAQIETAAFVGDIGRAAETVPVVAAELDVVYAAFELLGSTRSP